MRWLQYLMICLLTLVIFAGGALFSHFIGDIKEILHIGERSHHYTLDTAEAMQIPYEQYESRVIISVPNVLKKTGSSDVERQQDLVNKFSRVLGEITDRVVKLPLYERGACLVQSKIVEDEAMIGEISCTITEKDIDEYKALLKEIDYLALKNGGLRAEVSSLYPVVDFAQIENTKQNLRARLLEKAHQSVGFYSAQTKRRCSLLASNERGAYSPNDVVARALGASKGSLSGTSLFAATLPITADIKLPLEKSAPLYLEARITIRCD
ncbi:hypothetical protein [Helicobacter canis]|uniref:DUF541 domain-containing protein n=1 Tax=Helicobacter canis TaxID=29419 RepID=A0A5M9QQG0_9HELI|nr:hypothetical protein [Helicobacter canis]KAA8710954.1 hypothetical protein F4V45_01520 [Helicobacter canis]